MLSKLKRNRDCILACLSSFIGQMGLKPISTVEFGFKVAIKQTNASAVRGGFALGRLCS